MRSRFLVIAGTIIVAALLVAWMVWLLRGIMENQPVPQTYGREIGHQHGGPPVSEKEAEPMAAATPQDAPTIEIPSEKQQLLGVRTVQVNVQPLKHTIRTVGLVEYDPTRVTTINTKVEGWIERLYVTFAGAYVRKGQQLVDLYSPELWATQQEFINLVRFARTAKARAAGAAPVTPGASDYSIMLGKDADVLLDAARQRLRLWDISDAQIRKIEESERPIRTLTIYSPVSGYVLQKQAVQGMRVMAGEKLFDVADLSTVWISADIYEYELPLVKVGDPATVQVSYIPGREYRSRIEYIYPALTGETRTAKVRFSIPNTGGVLKPQMYTNVELRIELGRRLAVPTDAVIDTGVRKIVYVDRGEGYFEPREVATGVQSDRFIEVTSGLKAGDRVASSANFLIDSEAKLKGVEALPGPKPGRKQAPAVPSPTTPMPAHSH